MNAVLVPTPAGISPKHVLLRVTTAAWDDLGISTPQRLDPASPILMRQPILRKFWDHYSKSENLDRGTPISQLEHSKVFRIKAGVERAATWYDAASGVIWLLRVLSLSKFPNEDALYDHFGSLERRDQLMPSGHEVQLARGQQYFINARAALADAMAAAQTHPGRWSRASIERPNGEVVEVGRAYVEQSEELAARYLIVPQYDQHPEDIRMPRAWLESVAAKCFPEDEWIEEIYRDLPPGADVQEGREHSLRQIRVEEP